MKTATADIATCRYGHGSGWSTSDLPQLDSEQTLVVAFGWPGMVDHPEPLRDLQRAYPTSHLIGCSTSGEIHGPMLMDESVAVAIMRFSETRLASACAPVETLADSHRAGTILAEQLAAPDLRAVFVLSDGLRVNGSSLVSGLMSGLGDGVVVTGGLAGDGPRFERTWVIRDGEMVDRTVTAVGFYGDRVRVGHGSQGGWDVFGPERVITRSEGSVLYELDGKPALPLYKHYLGERAKGLPASALLFPLSLRRDRQDPNRVVRTILAVDEAAETMTFAGDVPEGQLAQLMRANFDRLIDGAEHSALMTRESGHTSGPCLCLSISCVGRRLLLGERTEEELERVAEVLPPGSSAVGFYSYGEISPLASGRCGLHNQTMTLTTIAEV